MMILDGQLGIAASQAYPICEHTDIGPDHRQASGEPCNRAQEIAKQYGDSVRFYYEADKSPFYQYQREACKECSCAFCFLFPSEEEECLLRTNDNRQTDEEEDLFCQQGTLSARSFGSQAGKHGRTVHFPSQAYGIKY